MMFRVFTMMQRATQLIFLDFQVNEINKYIHGYI
jgi:hypothetical protein